MINISAPFIKRPVATILLAIALIGGGLFAYTYLPVAALPNVDFPVVTVSASLPGASPDTMANSVATPLIKQFSTIPAITTMTAKSVQGSTSIVIQFDLNRDIDQAAADVQAAIARTLRQLPANMTTPPSYRKVNPADAPIVLLALQDTSMSLSKLDDFAEDVMSPALSEVDGVGEVQVFGAKKYAVRAEVNPTALAGLGIGIDQVTSAVGDANSIAPVGTLAGPAQNLAIDADTQKNNAAEFSQIIIASPNGKPIRLGDVANVVDSVANTQTQSSYDGTPALVLAVFRQPDANTVQVVDNIKAMLPQFRDDLGSGGNISVLNDRSTSIVQAVNDVELTLALTIGLVAMVIFLFLRRVSATLIPTLAVPISLIATFAAMYAFGFSIDNISLLGLTLAVGLVVDDAIVMLENIVRHVEEGMRPFEAALAGSREVGFTIVSITISLVAVFLPVLLMGGVVGRIFNEFAMVVTISIIASSLVSLTLTPMLCARLPALDPSKVRSAAHGEEREGWFKAGYRVALDFCFRMRPLILLLFFGTVALSAWLFVVSPKGFLPTEDIGQLSVSTQARQDISFADMATLQSQVEKTLSGKPYVEHVASVVGGGFGASTSNTGSLFVELKPKNQRPALSAILDDLRKSLGQIAGISSFVTPVQDLRLGGQSSASTYQYQLQGIDRDDLLSWSTKMADAMGRDTAHFADVTTDIQDNAPQAELVVDTDKAELLGISAEQLRNSLYDGFGTNQASTIFKTGDSYEVIVEYDPKIPWTSDMLNTLTIRSASTGKLVPLSSFAQVKQVAGLLSVNQVGQLPAVTISFNLPTGESLGQATDQIAVVKQQIGVPATITSQFAGTAQVFQQAVAGQGLLLFAAILTIYIVLGILYESFVHPLTILTGLPAAVVGALLSLRIFNFDLSVIAIIGMLMLIGIVKKNAIMMIDFALVRQRAGATPLEAIRSACLIRFRPIMMTTMAALMGSLPIALGLGASAELRQPLGVAVVGGLIVSQALTLFITPVIYLYMEALSERLSRFANLFRRREVLVDEAELKGVPAE